MPKAEIAPPVAEIRARIRATGLRSTGPRIAVLRHLGRSAMPISHAEIADALEPAGFDRATLYRNLIDLTDAGLLSRTDYGDHVWRYELRDGRSGEVGKHPHFTCIDCGDVACLPGARVEISVPRRSPRALRKRRFEVQFTGVCDRCAA